MMQLILDDYGIALDKKDDMFFIRKGENIRSVSPVKINAIHIYKNANVSTAALLMAAENDIPVLIYDNHYKPAIRVWNSNFSSTGQVRILQPLFCQSNEGVGWAKILLKLKTEGQLHNLKIFRDRFAAAKAEIDEVALRIKNVIKKMDALPALTTNIEVLQGYEGIASAWYWKALNALLGDAVFTRRMQHEPNEPFNACLNYLYGILYGKVEGALLAYGLDPMVGIIHAEGYSKKCLVYDCIEPYRPWADLLLVQMFNGNDLLSAHFEYREDKMMIAKEGRKLLAYKFIDFMNEKTTINEHRICRNDQILAICSQLAQAVRKFDNPKIK